MGGNKDTCKQQRTRVVKLRRSHRRPGRCPARRKRLCHLGPRQCPQVQAGPQRVPGHLHQQHVTHLTKHAATRGRCKQPRREHGCCTEHRLTRTQHQMLPLQASSLHPHVRMRVTANQAIKAHQHHHHPHLPLNPRNANPAGRTPTHGHTQPTPAPNRLSQIRATPGQDTPSMRRHLAWWALKLRVGVRCPTLPQLTPGCLPRSLRHHKKHRSS
jgi:hypothetical protein